MTSTVIEPGADGLYHPATEAEVIALVAFARANGKQLRARGSTHSVAWSIYTDPVAGTPPNRTLTRRQREALQWVGDGKTTQDIAQIMGLTQATIEKHLRLARDALNVETTAQAVLKAAFQNQMFVLEA